MFHEKIYKELPNTHYIRKYLHFLQKYSKFATNYMEKHHILPVANFPEYIDCAWNIISISPRVHILAHYMLAKALGGGYWQSVNIMVSCNNPYQHRKGFTKLSSKLYEVYKLNFRKAQSECSVTKRKTESEDTKQSRIVKWRESRNSVDIDVYNASFKQGRNTRKLNLELGITKRTVHKKILCIKCSRMIAEPQYNRHVNSINCGRPPPVAINYCTHCGIEKYKTHKCKVLIKLKKLDKIFTCIKCDKIYERELCYISHTKVCTGYKPIKRKTPEERLKMLENKIKNKVKRVYVAKDRKFRICELCDEKFYNKRQYDFHIEYKHCTTTAEYRQEQANQKRALARASKSDEENLLTYKKISEKVSAYRNNMSESEKIEFQIKTTQGIINYYNSDAYSPEIRSEQVKHGINENKRNKKD